MSGTPDALRTSNQKVEFGNPSRVRIWLRMALLIFGLALFAQATWIVVAEFYHTRVIRLALDDRASVSTRPEQDRAQQAASLAGLRGDLWAESALTYSSRLWTDLALGAELSPELARAAQIDMENAVRYSPHRGDVWLMFAGMAARYKWKDYKPSSLLKMSYYTAPNEAGLIPLRLMISLREWTDDPELQDMILREIRVVLTRLPNLRSSLTTAYKAASPQGKAAVEQLASKIDASYLASINGKSR